MANKSNEDKIASLEHRIEELDGQLATLREQLSRAQLDQWEGRIDDLELQMHLGSMEMRESLSPVVEKLRNGWLDAQKQVASASSTAGDILDSLHKGLEQAMKDIRDAVADAKG